MKIEYAPGVLSAAEVHAALGSIWSDLQADGDAADRLRAAGVLGEPLSAVITVRPAASGIDPLTVALIVAFAPTANHLAQSLWDELLLPRLRRDTGSDSLGEERRRET